MIEAAIFDLDGTLIDSEPTYWVSWRKVFAPLGVELTDDDLRGVTGMRPNEVIEVFASKGGISVGVDETIEELMSHMLSNTERDLMPGVRAALKTAKAAGLRMAIATGSPQRLAEASLASTGFRDLFEVVVSSEFEAAGKPDPAVFLTAARSLGVDPASCVVIEDAPNGVLAAKAAGMRCVVVPEHGHRGNPNLKKADVELGSLTELTREHLLGAR